VDRLVEQSVPLTVCPLSNVALQVVATMPEHPLPTMLQRGLVVTVNSDDPAYFGGYVNDNYRAVSDALSLRRDEIVTIVRNGVHASLMTPEEKTKVLGEIDRVLAETA
jgi:adenosine deaminase